MDLNLGATYFLVGMEERSEDRSSVMTPRNQDGNLCNGIQSNTSIVRKVTICE